jgi:Tfp pilus assembly protein PilO
MNVNALKRPAVLITVAVVVVLAVIWWFVWMSPEGTKLNTVNSQNSQLQTQLTTLNIELQQAQKQAAKVQQYAGYLSMFAAAVPPIPEAPQLTTELADLANTTNVHLVSLSDDTTVVGTPLSTIPLSMDIEGPRQNCIAFLQGIYNPTLITRLITISAFNPAPVSAGSGGVDVLKPSSAAYTVTISGTAYFDPEIDPLAANATSSTTTTTAAG